MNRNELLRISNITKNYRGKPVLDNIQFIIESGKIYGLVGENGAGKTTLLRILSSLIFPTEGHFYRKDNLKIGILIESPNLFMNLSAEENLKYLAIRKGLEVSSVNEVLHLINLPMESWNKKVKDFSLGMRQRLGIGMALLGKPDLLILDEPINGLDPTGIKDIRDLLLKLNKEEGITILISSHILSELEFLADEYIILHKGRVVERLQASKLHELLAEYIYVRSTKIKDVQAIFEKNKIIFHLEGEYIVVLSPGISTKEIAKLLIKNNINFLDIFHKKRSFEYYYLNSINKENTSEGIYKS